MRVAKLGDEVSQKVKSAIKAKLMELGIHIDNELPDYVMVLVANKKTQKQMEDDLNLFLGENTKLFTSWLHEVLKKLEKVTSSVKSTKKKSEDKKIRSKRRSVDGSDEEIINKKFKTDDFKKLEPNHNSNGSEADAQITLREEGLSDFELEFDDNKNNYIPESKENISQTAAKDNFNKLISGQKEESKDNMKDKVITEKEDTKQRERIKIVWDDRDTKNSQLKSKKDKMEPRNNRRSKSREKERYKSRKREKSSDKDYSRSKTDRYKGRSRSPRYYEKHNNDHSGKKVVDARDILMKRGVPSENNRSRKREPTPTSKSSRDNKEKHIPSVLKAIVREPPRDEKPSVPSLVKVTPRPVRPPSMQPSCNLILRAVADAEKSVATSKVNSKPENKRHLEYEMQGNISVTLVNDRVSTTKPDFQRIVEEPNESSPSLESNGNYNDLLESKNEDDTISMVVDSEDYIESIDSQDLCVPNPLVKKNLNKNGTKKDKTGKRFIITLDSTASDNELENDFDMSKLESEENMEIENQVIKSEADSEILPEVPVEPLPPIKVPFDRSRLGPKVEDNSSDFNKVTSTTPAVSPMDISHLEVETAETLKSQTRCKFWPGCDAGDLCPYNHPTTLCRMFPTCLYGDKCLYIHPACKFADKCLNTSCPYTHTSITPKPKPIIRPPIAPTASAAQICMYFPKCSKPFCPFLHIAKPCRFGKTCTKVGCEFSHPGKNNPYKWVASQ